MDGAFGGATVADAAGGAFGAAGDNGGGQSKARPRGRVLRGAVDADDARRLAEHQYRPASRGRQRVAVTGRGTSTASPRACRPGVCSARRRPSPPIKRVSGPPPRTQARALLLHIVAASRSVTTKPASSSGSGWRDIVRVLAARERSMSTSYRAVIRK